MMWAAPGFGYGDRDAMKSILKSAFVFVFALCLTGCKSGWQEPIPEGVIIYQGEGIYNSLGHHLGFVQPDGSNNQVLLPDQKFERPVWSADGEFLYGLTNGSGSYYGYPSYWDFQNGRFGSCEQSLPFFMWIQGPFIPDNPYEVIVGSYLEIMAIDLSDCDQTQTLVDYSNALGNYKLSGFSYFSSTQDLVYGLIVDPDSYYTQYQLVLKNLETGTTTNLAEGINPSWSPDGTRVAYIGMDGLFILDLSDPGSQTRQILSTPFFDPIDDPTPSWSPDGEWLVYHRCEAAGICTWKDATIYKISSSGGAEEAILQGGEYPSWRP